MAYIDWTANFRRIAARHAPPGVGLPDTPNAKTASLGTFNHCANKVASEIKAVKADMDKLKLATRGQGLFNNTIRGIDDLVVRMKRSLAAATDGVDELRKTQTTQISKTKHHRAHVDSVIHTFSGEITTLTVALQNLVKRRSEALQNQQRRRRYYATNPGIELWEYDLYDTNSNSTADPNSVELVPQLRKSTQSTTMDYARERAEGAEHIRRLVGDLGLIFQKMAHLVTNQDSMVKRIDCDLESSVTYAELGQGELLTYFNKISKNRTLLLKIFAILVVLLVLFILCFA